MLSSRIWSSISVALSCQLWLAVSQGRTSKALKTDATPDSAAVWWVINSVAFYQDKQKDLLQGGGCQVVRAFSNVKARAEAGKRSKWSSASGATWAQDNGIAPFCITPEGQYKDSAKVYVSYDELANDNVMYIVHRGLRQDSSEDKISGDSIQMQGVWTTNDDTLMLKDKLIELYSDPANRPVWNPYVFTSKGDDKWFQTFSVVYGAADDPK